LAVAAPIPDPAPETMTTLSANLFIPVLLYAQARPLNDVEPQESPVALQERRSRA